MEAVGQFVLIIRDTVKTEENGFIIPGQGQEKPHSGEIYSVGDLIQSKRIQKAKGKKCLFFKGNGFDIDYADQTYLVIEGERIISIL